MKKLPKIFQNTSTKIVSCNKKSCQVISKENRQEENNRPNIDKVKETINEIFSGIGYSYNIPVNIKTKEKEYRTSLIARTKQNIVTLDNEVINIKDIISIEKIVKKI